MIEDYIWTEEESGNVTSYFKLCQGIEAHIEIFEINLEKEGSPYQVSIAVYSNDMPYLQKLYELSKALGMELVIGENDFIQLYGECILAMRKATCLIDAKRHADHFLILFKEKTGLNNGRFSE